MPICRLCLFDGNEKQTVSVWKYETNDLAKKIKDCVSIEIRRDDRLPVSVCFSCIEQVARWETFKNNCQKANDLLRRELENEPTCDIQSFKNSKKNIDIINNVENTKSDSESEESCEESEEEEEEKPLKFEFFDEIEDTDLKALVTNNIYKCDICCKEFDDCLEFLDHQVVHDGRPVFSCDKCDEVFSYRRDLLSHDRNHKIPCPQCSKIIAKTSMKMHLIIHSEKFKCEKCGGTFNSRAALANHTIQVHTDIKDYVCDFCGKLFACRASLNVHLRIHSDERLYKCKKCDYSGRTASALYAHMATHANDLCSCQYCPKTFKSSRNLGDHLRRVHSKEKKHACSYCDKRFVDKYTLSVHKRWHTGDRRYKCVLCDKAFIRSDGLKEHMATHNPRTYDCGKCGKQFNTKRSVVRHSCNAVTTTV